MGDNMDYSFILKFIEDKIQEKREDLKTANDIITAFEFQGWYNKTASALGEYGFVFPDQTKNKEAFETRRKAENDIKKLNAIKEEIQKLHKA